MTRYRISADVLWRRSLDRVLAIRRGDVEVTVMAGGAVAVWDLLERALSPVELTAALQRTHAAVLPHEVRAVVDDLVQRGLVEAVE